MADETNGPSPAELGSIPLEDLEVSPTSESPVNEELTTCLREIDASITARHIQSKFSGDVVLHGELLAKASHPTLIQILPGDVNDRDLDPTGQFGGLTEIVRKGVFDPKGATELEKLFGDSHVFAVLDDRDNPEFGTLQYIYPVGGVDNAHRRFLTLEVFLKMPEEKLGELVSILVKNPDAVEQFYQIATNGLDRSVQRRKSSQAVGINLEKFMPEERFQHPNVGLSQLASDSEGQKRLDLSQFTILQYTKPQGQFTQAEIDAAVQMKLEEDKRKREIAQKLKEASQPAVRNPDPPASKSAPKTSRPSPLQGGPLEGLPNLIRRIIGPRGSK